MIGEITLPDEWGEGYVAAMDEVFAVLTAKDLELARYVAEMIGLSEVAKRKYGLEPEGN